MKVDICINKKDKCYCGKVRECINCNNKLNLKDNKCILGTSSFCTCRHCGEAVRADGYSFKK